MLDHELDALALVYEKLAEDKPLDDKLRSYLVGRLEQLLAPYKVEQIEQQATRTRKSFTDVMRKVGL